jgi:hypothetical protein
MKQFCKLCVITAFYTIFWLPNAFHLSWNLIEPINSSSLTLSNILYLIPFIITPIIGLFIEEDEAIFVFSGGFIASLLQLVIASADSLTGYQNYWNQPFTYFPHLFKMFIQLIFLGIGLILSTKITTRFKSHNDLATPEDDKPSKNEEILATS